MVMSRRNSVYLHLHRSVMVMPRRLVSPSPQICDGQAQAGETTSICISTDCDGQTQKKILLSSSTQICDGQTQEKMLLSASPQICHGHVQEKLLLSTSPQICDGQTQEN